MYCFIYTINIAKYYCIKQKSIILEEPLQNAVKLGADLINRSQLLKPTDHDRGEKIWAWGYVQGDQIGLLLNLALGVEKSMVGMGGVKDLFYKSTIQACTCQQV